MRLFLLTLALAAGCAQSQPTTEAPATAEPTAEAPVATWGASFGMCQGYCVSTLTVAPDGTATFTETTRGDDPPLVQTRAITAEERARLDEALAASTVETGRLGCPDCADGGAEYVATGGERLDFEYNGDAGAAAPLAEAMRAIVRGFPGRR